MDMSTSSSVFTLASGDRIKITAQEIHASHSASEARRPDDDRVCWLRMLEAARGAKRHGRTAFRQAMHGSSARPGFMHQELTDSARLSKLFTKVEALSRLGKMHAEVEILDAMTESQRQQHVADPQRFTARPIAQKRKALDQQSDAKHWQQKYEESRAEVARLQADVGEMMGAIQTSQEIESENDELRTLANGLATENESLRRELRTLADGLAAENEAIRRELRALADGLAA